MVAPRVFRVVLDTNTVLAGLATPTSASGRLLRAAEARRLIPLLSKPVLDEYNAVLSDPEVRRRFPSLEPGTVTSMLGRLQYVGDYVRDPAVRFEFARDRLDEKFVELAIALRATHLITFDRDLLWLGTSRTDAGRRFRQRLPATEVMPAGDFMRKYGSLLRT